MKLHLVMPMAGKGSRFLQDGFNLPKPLIKIHNKPFFYWATESIARFYSLVDITFVRQRNIIVLSKCKT